MYLYRLIVLSLLVSGSTYITWYGGNYYAAGLVDQTMLIEFDMDDDFWYCYNWRPDKLDINKKIKRYESINGELVFKRT